MHKYSSVYKRFAGLHNCMKSRKHKIKNIPEYSGNPVKTVSQTEKRSFLSNFTVTNFCINMQQRER